MTPLACTGFELESSVAGGSSDEGGFALRISMGQGGGSKQGSPPPPPPPPHVVATSTTLLSGDHRPASSRVFRAMLYPVHGARLVKVWTWGVPGAAGTGIGL